MTGAIMPSADCQVFMSPSETPLPRPTVPLRPCVVVPGLAAPVLVQSCSQAVKLFGGYAEDFFYHLTVTGTPVWALPHPDALPGLNGFV